MGLWSGQESVTLTVIFVLIYEKILARSGYCDLPYSHLVFSFFDLPVTVFVTNRKP
jgi:hypothetical protein